MIITKQHQRHDGKNRSLRFLALFDRASDRNPVGCRKARVQFCDRGSERVDHGFGQYPRADFGLYGQCRDTVAPPDQRVFLSEVECRDLTERNGAAVRKRDLQSPQSGKRQALFVGCSGQDVDEVDAVPDLRNGFARHHAVHDRGNRLRAQAQQPRLILVDADADHASRLHPIEIDMPRTGIGCHDLGELKPDVPHFADIRAAHSILHRPPDRRTQP